MMLESRCRDRDKEQADYQLYDRLEERSILRSFVPGMFGVPMPVTSATTKPVSSQMACTTLPPGPRCA
jgi:hypothetical protein